MNKRGQYRDINYSAQMNPVNISIVLNIWFTIKNRTYGRRVEIPEKQTPYNPMSIVNHKTYEMILEIPEMSTPYEIPDVYDDYIDHLIKEMIDNLIRKVDRLKDLEEEYILENIFDYQNDLDLLVTMYPDYDGLKLWSALN